MQGDSETVENWLPSATWPPKVALVESARSGDPIALARIYRTIQPRLKAFLRYQGFERATCDDIASDVSEVVLAKLETLREAVTFQAWFWAITRNRIRAHVRRRQRDSNHAEPPAPAVLPPDETVILQEEHDTIRRALATLSQKDRDLLWLREVEGLSYKDISGRLDTATGTVRVRCHRARQRLESAYEEAATKPRAVSPGRLTEARPSMGLANQR